MATLYYRPHIATNIRKVRKWECKFSRFHGSFGSSNGILGLYTM
jgi:hypothetical protein